MPDTNTASIDPGLGQEPTFQQYLQRVQTHEKEVESAAAKKEAGAQELVKEATAQGKQQTDLAQAFANSQDQFAVPEPQEQINSVMQGAPWLFALTAIGGKISGAGGLAMLEGLNGVSSGIIAGDEEATNQAWKKYDAAFNKWKANKDQQVKVYQTLSQAYGTAGDAKLRAMQVAQQMTDDASAMRLGVDDPDKIFGMYTKLEEAHAKMMDARTKRQIAGAAAGSGMPPGWSQDDIDYYARQSIAGDQSWRTGLGRTKEGVAIIRAVDRRVPELTRQYGLTPEAASAGKDIRKSLDSALNDRQKNLAAASQYVGNFRKQSALVEKYLAPGIGGEMPALNRWVQAGRKAVSGDAEVSALDTAIRGMAREHQRIVTGVTSNAQLHASAQETADKLLNIDQTPEQVRATLQVMMEEAQNAIESGQEEVGSLQTQLSQMGIAGRQHTPDSAAMRARADAILSGSD